MLARPLQPAILALAAYFAWSTGSPTEGKEPNPSLQGLFCNTQEQIDETLKHVDLGLSPRAAAELLNKSEIVCTYVDRLYYVVKHPIKVGAHRGRLSVFKYEAILTGVIVGDNFRAVFPEVRIFFITPEPLVEISLGQRT